MYKKSIISIVIALGIVWSMMLSVSAKVVIDEVGSSIFPGHFMRSEGRVNALVIPVQFVDFRFSEDPVATLDEMFNSSGSSLASSVADYFENASYGEMQFSAGVQEVVTLPDLRKNYGENHADLIKELLAVLEGRGVDFSQFDQNKDGILDGLYIIWAGAAQSAGSSWWPYSDTFYFEFVTSGIQIGSYSSLSYELMTQNSALRQYTAIHETGHQLGLTDYYASSYEGGTGASVMMDRNEGDEDCFSKTLLGWISPQIVQSSQYITLSSASTSADAALIAPSSWDGNYLSEYFMAEYVTPEANQSSQALSAGGGVRIWHVNSATSQWTDEITSSMYRYQNGDDGPKLLTVVDTSRQWYGAGEGVSEEQTLLYSDESTGIAIWVEDISDGQAQLRITYFGEEPAKPETSEPISDTEESILESSETASKDLSHMGPVLFIIVLGILVYFVLSGNLKKKHKKRRKRKK